MGNFDRDRFCFLVFKAQLSGAKFYVVAELRAPPQICVILVCLWIQEVALSAGESGAPVSSKAAHMDREFLSRSGYSDGPLVRRVVFTMDFQVDPLLLLCCNALQVLC